MLAQVKKQGAAPREGGGAHTGGDATLPVVPSTANAALDYLRQRERLLARIQRVNDALCAYDEYEANRHLPPDLRRQLRKPTLSREALTGLHRMLVEELGRLEQEWERRN